MGKTIYVNFPVCLLSGAFENIQFVTDNIFDYAIYKHSQNLEFNDELSKIKSASNFFNVNLGLPERSLENGKNLLQQHIKSPNASINISIIWDFYNNKKGEFDIACFCAFCAIKSILGNKNFVKTNKKLILLRMFGENIQKNEVLFNKYSARYHIDKILIKLQEDWGLKLYSDHSRGFYLSFKNSLKSLAEISLFKKEKIKKKILVERKKKATEAALVKLNFKLKNV